jgi:hypothetical protein
MRRLQGEWLMNAKPFTSAEIAERLGITRKTFYIRRHRLHVVDKMPRPISEVGKPKWDRAGMEAWLTRNDPRLPQVRAANDAIAPPMPSNDVQWSEFLRRHYAGQPAE